MASGRSHRCRNGATILRSRSARSGRACVACCHASVVTATATACNGSAGVAIFGSWGWSVPLIVASASLVPTSWFIRADIMKDPADSPRLLILGCIWAIRSNTPPSRALGTSAVLAEHVVVGQPWAVGTVPW
jgi:hypothetical protein